MAKNVITKSGKATITIDEADSTWILKKGVTLSGAPAFFNDNQDMVTFRIHGTIASTGEGIEIKAASAQSLLVAKSATIATKMDGVHSEGSITIENEGLIRSATGSALYHTGNNLNVENTGTILGKADAAIESPDCYSFSIRNDGLIGTRSSDGTAVRLGVDSNGLFINGAHGRVDGGLAFTAGVGDITVINRGQFLRDAADGGAGIQFGTGNDSVLNTGLLKGGVSFGDGEDSLVSRGRISQSVLLGDGDDTVDVRKDKSPQLVIHGNDGGDTFTIDDTSVKIVETADGGDDTIRTTVSYTLGHGATGHIETLSAIGKDDVKLAGNQRENTLSGNVGDNSLIGGKGDDKLIGMQGNDVLKGGADADDFHFHADSGVDRILDFKPGEDQIYILNVPDIDEFTDLFGRVSMADNGKDTIIDLGDGNRIRLVGVAMDELGMGDFNVFG